MTPFAILGEMRKEASGGAVMKLIDRLRRAGRGALRAPGDQIGAGASFLDGGLTGMHDMNNFRAEGLKALNLGRAGDLGNFVGNVGLGGATVAGSAMGVNRLIPAEHGRDWKGAPLPSPAEQQRQKERGIIDNMHFGKEASSVEIDESTIRRERDERALRNRHIALALKRAIQGGLLGAGVGSLGAANEEGGMDGSEGALLGLLSGGLAGAGLGAAEGGIKRSLGLDPTLQTFLTAQRA